MQPHTPLLCCIVLVVSFHEAAGIFVGWSHLYPSYNTKWFHSNGKVLIWYGNNWDWDWVLHSNHFVKFGLTSFDVEDCCDKVYAYSHYSSSSGGKLVFTANGRGKCDFPTCSVDHAYVLQGPVRIRFITDYSVFRKGFWVHYESLPYSYGCNTDDLSGSSGYFKHRKSHLLTYGNNWDCRRVIRTSGIIRIDFRHVDMEHSHDKVHLYEEAASVYERKLYKTLSSSSDYSRTYYLQGPVVVRLKTDGSVTKSGFYVSYQRVESNYGCSSVSLYPSSGSISSQPPGMKTYKNNWDCSWRLRNRQTYRLRFSSHDLQLPNDKVYLYERADYARGNNPKVVLSSSSQFSGTYTLRGPVVIRFRTDSSEVRTGFRLSYSSS